MTDVETKVMKEKGIHEGTIEQMQRLFAERLYNDVETPLDDKGRIRVDDLEMRDDVQNTIFEYWDKVTTENLTQYADVDGYWNDFYNLFGFGFDNVDYDADVNPEVNLDLVE